MFFSKNDKYREVIDHLSLAGTMGLNLVSSTFIGLAMGWALDKWLETKPWFTLIMLIVGVIAGFRSVYQDTRRIQKSEARKEKGDAPDADKEHKDPDDA
ncbi:MAG: AtpZ/AtpI family protein [Desulfovibrionaceae bacterium]